MALRAAWFVAAFLVVCGGLVVWPAIDLAASAPFYAPGQGFVLADWMPFRLLHEAPPYLVAVAIAGAIAVAVAPRWGSLRAGLFLLLALAIGPGLVVNTVFKDHWGRARPAQVIQFGGDKRFSPAFVPSDQCDTNCSFPAGDPAVGFFFVSAGFLIPTPGRRRLAIVGAIGLGGMLGLARMAQGGHFLSDVLASGFFVWATCWLLHRWIVAGDGLATLWRQLRRPPPALRRFTLGAVGAAAMVALSIAWLDRPLALYFAGTSAGVTRFFRVVTQFGVSTFYLVAAAAIALGCAARGRWLPARRAAFVFVAVAGAGLAGDILKPVFGRARPVLLLRQGIFGFTWHGAHADYWSFPSGHVITITALAGALWVIERRGWPLYLAGAVLVAASRIVLDEHYLSDVLAGAFLAGDLLLGGRRPPASPSGITLEAIEHAHDEAARSRRRRAE